MLQLNVAKLKRAPGNEAFFKFSSNLPPQELAGEGIRFPDPVEARLNVVNTGDLLVVQGKISGRLLLSCNRCLEHFSWDFEVPFEESYAPATGGGNEYLTFSGDMMDITPEVLKSIMLALPMKLLCRDDCKGICPECGRNLNEHTCNCSTVELDPRLSVLKDFFKE
ncbi:MAG: DUF177 domain-containing protein [Desulfotomaculaceae bacterium]|nr:DUF177 domain-containing protein [Desulfotomaculaceae bacterium]